MLREEDRLCIMHEDERTHEPRICSLGLSADALAEKATNWAAKVIQNPERGR